MAAWWVDCSVCLVAAPLGARLPRAATVGTFPAACSRGVSPPSAPTSLADTSHPAEVALFPAASSTTAAVRRCTPPFIGGSLFCAGPSRATFGPALVKIAAPLVTQCFWKAAIGPSSWLNRLAFSAFACSYSMRCCSRAFILPMISFFTPVKGK